MINSMYRVCNDGPMFESHEEAETWMDGNIAGGTVWIDALAWCSDCQEWVVEGRMEHCPDCGAKWYDEEGKQGFRGGVGKQKWAELKAQKQRDRQALAAWNAGEPIRA